MAKISPTSIKYSVIADFTAEGPFQKPDVIGALFGQTEGLLGTDMELRELQKEGKIGRIEVELNTEDGKTTGEIVIPSALDKAETTIIGAAIETIDKIGPTDAKITIREIEDVRGSKRDYIMQRAKELLAKVQNEGMNSQEIGNELRDSSKTAKAITYGEEGLSAGPEIETAKEIIVVEGRADVMNLLKAGINNAIGMQGTRFPKTITKLGETKEITLFVDGDRGGKLIAENVCNNANIAYVTSAPDGKEVEELTGKEILQALRKKVTTKEYFKGQGTTTITKKETRTLTDKEIEQLRELANELKGRNVLVLGEKLDILHNIPASKLTTLREHNALVIMSASATSSVIIGAEKLGVSAVAARNFGKIPETKLQLVSL